MRAVDDTTGAVRVEDVYDTDIQDLWEACTTPDRLARWIATVTGEPVLGGTVHATFTSTWSGQVRIDECEAPRHLLVTSQPGADDETQTELWLTAEGDCTRLVVEERGLPIDAVHFYGAGWQAHLEDLAASLTSARPVHAEGWSSEEAAPSWKQRWEALTPDYRERAVS